MDRRIYYGVDLNLNFTDLIKAEIDEEKRLELLKKREFKIGCLVREKDYFFVGSIIVDRNREGWIIKEIEGQKIEEMRLHVVDKDENTAVFDAIDVVRLQEVELEDKLQAIQYAILTAVGMDEETPQLRRPYWFEVVDQVKQMERDSWDKPAEVEK